eukprot:2633381-Pleurochrysis_carterae.AAC.7
MPWRRAAVQAGTAAAAMRIRVVRLLGDAAWHRRSARRQPGVRRVGGAGVRARTRRQRVGRAPARRWLHPA